MKKHDLIDALRTWTREVCDDAPTQAIALAEALYRWGLSGSLGGPECVRVCMALGDLRRTLGRGPVPDKLEGRIWDCLLS